MKPDLIAELGVTPKIIQDGGFKRLLKRQPLCATGDSLERETDAVVEGGCALPHVLLSLGSVATIS